MTDYQALCREFFGTDDVAELKAIAGRLRSGRKKALTAKDIAEIVSAQKAGETVAALAGKYGVSRQTVSKYLNPRRGKDFPLRIHYMHQQRICTVIDVDFRKKMIRIENRTDDIMKRAFGVKEDPDWNDFQVFLQSRCFPAARDGQKELLQKLGVSSFDLLQIAEKTKGRMAEDPQYLIFRRKGAQSF